MQDLFETPEKIPSEVATILDKHREGEFTYSNLPELKAELEKVGYTIDYCLDAIPFDLRKVEKINELEQIIHSK